MRFKGLRKCESSNVRRYVISFNPALAGHADDLIDRVAKFLRELNAT